MSTMKLKYFHIVGLEWLSLIIVQFAQIVNKKHQHLYNYNSHLRDNKKKKTIEFNETDVQTLNCIK